MTLLQRLINLTAIIASIALLAYLRTAFSQNSAYEDEVLQLVGQIGNGEGLNAEEQARLSQLVGREDKKQREDILCFLKAYDQIVMKGKLDPQATFRIFSSGKEFSGVSTCSHYYSLLAYRAIHIQNKEKVRIQAKLKELLAAQFKPQPQTPICVFFHAYNSQITAKDQTASIVQQEYGHFMGVIDIDGAADNAKMFVKYTLDDLKGKSANITVKGDPQRKGFISTFQRAVEKECSSDSIVLVLDKNSILLSSSSLSIINQHFSSAGTGIAFFKSLTIAHENIESNQIGSLPHHYPVLAFRKSAFQEIASFLSKISQLSKDNAQMLDYQYQLLTYSLLKDPEFQQKVSTANEAIVYRQERTIGQQSILRMLTDKL